MNRLLSCRRTFIATISLLLLTGLSLHNNIDVQTSIVTIVLGLRCNKDYKQGIDDMSGVNESMFGNRNIFLAYLVFAATRTSISSGIFFESCYPG